MYTKQEKQENSMQSNVFIHKRDHGITFISNDILKSNKLSLKAKGLYSFLCTLPEGQEIHKTELTSCSSDGKDSVFTAFSELEEAGFLEKKCSLDNGLRRVYYNFTRELKGDN